MSLLRIAAEPVTEASYDLAEGPLLDPTGRRVLWVDIPRGLVLVGTFEDGRLVVGTRHGFEACVGTAAFADDGSILVAETRHLTRIAPDGSRTSTPPLEVLGPDDRFNDGLCDARGRFLVGTLSLTGTHRDQHLLQVGPEGTTVLDDDLGLSNGLGFSPDGTVLYSVDSVPGRIWRRDYDQATGTVGARTLLLDLPDVTPDGLTVDADGRLWIALWGSGQVRCCTTDGEVLATVTVPAPHTSSVAFVGADLDRLLVTTARTELTDAQLDEAPGSGSLFLADPGCRGLAPFPWSGHLPA